MNKSKEVFFQGFIKENPIFRLVLGMCSFFGCFQHIDRFFGHGYVSYFCFGFVQYCYIIFEENHSGYG